jgi:hypothetical protein
VAWCRIAQQQIGWAGLHSRSNAWLEGEGDGGESSQHFESSINGSLEAAFALGIRPRAGAGGRQHLDERGRRDSSMSVEGRSTSEAKWRMGWEAHVSAGRAQLEELRTVRGLDAAGGRLAGAVVLSPQADNRRSGERNVLGVNK